MVVVIDRQFSFYLLYYVYQLRDRLIERKRLKTKKKVKTMTKVKEMKNFENEKIMRARYLFKSDEAAREDSVSLNILTPDESPDAIEALNEHIRSIEASASEIFNRCNDFAEHYNNEEDLMNSMIEVLFSDLKKNIKNYKCIFNSQEKKSEYAKEVAILINALTLLGLIESDEYNGVSYAYDIASSFDLAA